MTPRRVLTILVGALPLLASSPAHAQAPHVVEPPEFWRAREARRFENQRRDCAAQWDGLARKNRTGGAGRDAFVADCAEAAAIARCHPPGSNPTCRYLARERRAGQPASAR